MYRAASSPGFPNEPGSRHVDAVAETIGHRVGSVADRRGRQSDRGAEPEPEYAVARRPGRNLGCLIKWPQRFFQEGGDDDSSSRAPFPDQPCQRSGSLDFLRFKKPLEQVGYPNLRRWFDDEFRARG